jgi:hypothetical protein
MRNIVWPLLVLTAASCGPQAQKPSARSMSGFPCLSPDSGIIAYGDILIDSAETGDASGVQLTFQMRADTLQGFVRNATGEIPPLLPLKDLKSYANGDSIRFWFGDSANKDISRYRFGCDQLIGTVQPFATSQSPGSTYVDTMRRSVPIKGP